MSSTTIIRLILLVIACVSLSKAFIPPSASAIPSSTTSLFFGIPSFGAKEDKKNDDKGDKDEDEKKIGLSGLAQLITAGMGSPFLGDFEGVDEETGKMMFSLEANNLVDEKGQSKQTSMPYFESGWVDPKDLEKDEEGFKWPWDK
uniref:Uncharacterized protein n=1 Tax=Thalassionema nitzschioides TaxID=33649 RepID=A0A6V0Z8G2_9STRA|mmetsp:Transcript_26816/g.40753  ORF Transcript_26816/g.40753 Transcript_26816/m.40753 type:complete len:145 (+) Transcript_26816:53-487(+)|eukprot:CAMPEP_0194201406 /NCGR_PEP_ID=MMETSP0156-20130528/1684_1 /TAXON_ID=33649 /ORGANISM="Thalassionema nitzschioides, Strain L26-B" /LENGTH=144 /DNA_ID=CAMNT_0038926585 /DNA_START=53 /DNA_END=487 /DNA_ORIENTATION=-